MLTTPSIEDLAQRAGTELGLSDYVEVSQETIDAFAELTGDHPCIHTDPARAAASTFEPAGGGKPVCVANALYRVYQ